jgi:hypothetical protein
MRLAIKEKLGLRLISAAVIVVHRQQLRMRLAIILGIVYCCCCCDCGPQPTALYAVSHDINVGTLITTKASVIGIRQQLRMRLA